MQKEKNLPAAGCFIEVFRPLLKKLDHAVFIDIVKHLENCNKLKAGMKYNTLNYLTPVTIKPLI